MTRSRIYTKTGDDGTTGLLYGGRVSKGDELVDAYGDIDEAVAALGAARAAGLEPRLSGVVLRLQRELFAVAADLAASPRQRNRLVRRGLPGHRGDDRRRRAADRRPYRRTPAAAGVRGAWCDTIRRAARPRPRRGRRAERHAVRARACGRPVGDEVLRYLNRLSDLLFVLARHAAGSTEEPASHD